MRKVFLWAMLAVFVCSAGVAFGADEPVPSTPPDTPAELTISSDALLGFGLYKIYSTDQPVILRVDGEPYFGNVKKFVATDVNLAAKVKADYIYSSYTMPHGTLTDTATGLRYMLNPGEWRGNFCDYNVNTELSNLAGHKVMWNLYTSPDVIVRAAVIPETSALSVGIADDEIVPYVKINHSPNSSSIGRIDLYFVKSGDWSTPVALGDTTVKIEARNSYDYYAREYFTNFNKAVRNSFWLGWDESRLQSLTVEYDKDGARYIWNFTPLFGAYSSIEFGELALENQPITITAGSSLDVTLKLPGRVDLTEYFNGEDSYYMSGYFLQPGNRSVLEVDDSSVSFDQSSASWNGLEYDEEKSTLSFRLLGVSPGRTVLRMSLPTFDTYYREIHVVSSDGDMHLETSTNTHGIALSVSSYRSRARFVNGKPYYPSAEFSRMNMALVVSGDYYYGGYLGLVKGTTTDIHRIYNYWDEEDVHQYEISNNEGVRYDTADSSNNSEHTSSFHIDSEKLDDYNVWIDLQNDEGFEVVSASLSALISGDYMTTAEQLTNFVPYFEMKHDPDNVNNIVSLDWSFINPATGEKVTPEVSNVSVNYEDVDDTSGTITDYDGGSVNFSYTYKGVNYTWYFYEMDYISYGYIPSFSMESGTSQDISMSIYNSANLEAIDLVIWDEDVVSADPVSFAPADEIFFTVNALKAGTTIIGVVFAREGYTSYDKYTHGYNTVRVAESSTPADYELTSGDIKTVFTVGTFIAPVIEGSTHYTNNGFIESVNVELVRDGYISEEAFYTIHGQPSGTIHFYSGDVELSSQDLYPSRYSSMYVDGVSFVQLSYGQYYPENNVTRIVWTASSDIITSGSADVPAGQLYSYRPCFKLKREGLNVSTLDYYFADSQDNNAGIPETISDIRVIVYTNRVSSIQNYDNSGTITLNLPEAFIDVIYIEFKDDGKRCYGYFSPVDKPYNTTSADVLGWDIDDPELPLVMTVGESLDVTLTAKNIETPSAFIGNSAIVSMDFISSTDYTVTVRLTAKSAGMTSIVLAEGSSMTLPREIWVADESGQVPHLTEDIDALIETLTSDSTTSGGWFSDDETTSTTTDYETGDTIEVLDGLSVYPRFAVPTDPSGDVYEQEWQEIYDNNYSYSAYMFTDDVEVLASRDAFAVFNEVSADLIARNPAQLPAVVLPEIAINDSGTYTFRVPVDNITLKGSRIFMHTYPLYGGNTPGGSSIRIPDGMSIDSSGDIHSLNADYSVSVKVTNPDVWRISSRDIYWPEGLAFSVEEVNSSGDITSVRIFTSGDYYDIENEDVDIRIYNRAENYYTWIGWSFYYDDAGMTYYDDEGTELEYISGDEYINVSVYLSYGTYAPVITAKATSNDVRLIRAALGYTPTPPNPPTPPTPPTPPAAFTLTASNSIVSITLPATATITLTTANASGDVTYASSAAWATISGDTVTLAPTSAGTFSVTFTATDSTGSTATTAITVRVTAPIPPASGDVRPPASGDVRPPASGDVRPPVSDDVRPPVSGDVNPASEDVTPPPAPGTTSPDVTPTPQPGPAPVSPDVRPVNPPADEPGQDSGNDSSDSGGDSSGGNTGGNSGDNSGGDSSSNVDTVSGSPTESTLDVSNNSIVEKIISVLQSISQAISRLITRYTEVAALPESAMGVERTADDLSESDLAAIPAGQEPAVVLPIMRVQKAAVYVFGVDLTNLRVGALIFLHMMPDSGTSSSGFAAADTSDEAYTFLDDNGNETDIVPPSRHVNIAAYMEPGKSYAPLITTSTINTNNGGNSGGNTDTDNGNTNTDTGTDTDTETAAPSGGSGGCDSGFGVIALAVLALTLRRRSSR